MTDRPLPAEIELIQSAERVTGHDAPETALSDLVGSCLDRAIEHRGAWELPQGARLGWLRRPLARLLGVYTQRQQRLDDHLIAALVAVQEAVHDLEMRVVTLERQLDESARRRTDLVGPDDE